jgi:hypothetical protein
MGFKLTHDGAGVALLMLASGYHAAEAASRIALTTLALDSRTAGNDLHKTDAILCHAVEIIKIIGKLENSGLMRTGIAKNDARALWGVANPSVERKEWIMTVLSDEVAGKNRLAQRMW